jgi:nicotinamide riboside kinase
MIIAVLGAQGTGKSSLIDSLKKLIPTNLVLTEAPATLQAVHLTLLMGLDLPWTPDQAKPDAASTRAQADSRLRAELARQACPFVVVYGLGAARAEAARQAIAHHSGQPDATPPQKNRPWQWDCEKCSDGGCEHRMFTGLLKTSAQDRPTKTDQ